MASGNGGDDGAANATATHQWILRRLCDGTGSSFPRELIHLGNRAVEKQREMNRAEGKHLSERLVGPKAIREAFKMISSYRCDTYLYSEFPHLARHFDVFRGSDTATFHREELYMLFSPLSPSGDEAIRALYDTGLLQPFGHSVDSSMKFKVPFLYRPGLGVRERRQKPVRKDRPPVHGESIPDTGTGYGPAPTRVSAPNHGPLPNHGPVPGHFTVPVSVSASGHLSSLDRSHEEQDGDDDDM
jgi:hypothetical protein